jgi:hypothetical protein
MEFRVSNEHVLREKRKGIYLILFLVGISAVLVAKGLGSDKFSDLFFPILGLLVLWSPIFSLYRRMKEGTAAYPTLELDEANGEVTVLHKDVKVIVDLSQIRNLRLQRKSGQLVSILVKTSSGENLRFDGYENIDVLASALERLTSKESITRSSFFHR